METLIENEISIELYDILSETFCVKDDKEAKEDLFRKIKVLFTQRKDVNLSYFKISEYTEVKAVEPKIIKKKKVIEKDDDSEEEIVTTKASITTTGFNKSKPKGLNIKGKAKTKSKDAPESKSKRPESAVVASRQDSSTQDTTEEEGKSEQTFAAGDYNCVKFKVYFEVDEDSPSKVLIKLLPQSGDEFESVFCRIFIGNTEVKMSNFEVEIVKSQLQLDLEAENEKRKEMDLRIKQQRLLAKIKAKEEKERKKKEKEDERI